jgi:ABC-type antimicrobial peptide transport system permease subunit
MLAMMAGAFAALGLTLAAVGLYGLLSFSVAGRTNEIGVRMALGASRTQVVWLVVRDAAALVTLGVFIGWPVAWGSSRAAERLLFNGHQPGTGPVATATALLAAVAAVAAWIPARRASTVDPMQALRHD